MGRLVTFFKQGILYLSLPILIRNPLKLQNRVDMDLSSGSGPLNHKLTRQLRIFILSAVRGHRQQIKRVPLRNLKFVYQSSFKPRKSEPPVLLNSNITADIRILDVCLKVKWGFGTRTTFCLLNTFDFLLRVFSILVTRRVMISLIHCVCLFEFKVTYNIL